MNQLWTEWDSCELMLASQPQDAIPVLIDQGDSDQFLADQLQPAVLAEAARQTAADDAKNPAATIIAIILLRPSLRTICAFMPGIYGTSVRRHQHNEFSSAAL